MRPESQGNNSMLGEDAAKVRPLDLSDGNNNAQQELASTAATAASASLASELSPFIPTAASLIAPMLESPLQVAMNMAGPSSASSSPMRDSSNSSLDSMTPRTSRATGTMKQQRRGNKSKSAYSSANKRKVKVLLPEEKLQAIECVLIHGQTKASVARTYRVPESTLRGWCKTHIALEKKKNLKPQGDSESSASSARSESPPNNPLTYPAASLAASTCPVVPKENYLTDSELEAQFGDLSEVNPSVLDYIKKHAKGVYQRDMTNRLANISKMVTALPYMSGHTGFSQMALSLAPNNPLFMADGLQNAKSNVNNNKLAAQTSHANFTTQNDVYNTIMNNVFKNASPSNYFLSNQVLNKNNSKNDQKTQHTIEWISQQAHMKVLEQKQAQAQAQAQSQSLQKELHQQQSQQQAAILLNEGTFSNVNSTGGWSPLVSATSTVNSTSPVTSTVTSQNFNNKPSRGIKSISDNPLLSSQTSTNYDLNQCLNLIKKDKKVSDNQTNGSTITGEDIQAGVNLGEKFMKFLEECGDPSVTQVQLNTLRSVIEKLKGKGRKSPTLKRSRKPHTTQKM